MTNPLSRRRFLSARVVVRVAAFVGLVLACGCAPAPAKPGPVIEITASYPAADAQVITDVIAATLEQSMNGVLWLERIESEARSDGTYRARVFLEPAATLPEGEVFVHNRVLQVELLLPELVRQQGIEVKLLPPTAMAPAVTLVLYDRSNADRPGLQRWARAVAQDFAKAEIPVKVKPAPEANEVPRLRLSLDRGACARLGVEYSAVDQLLRSAGPMAKAETLQQAELPATSGEKIRLTDVATIETINVPESICRYNLSAAYYFAGTIPPGKTVAETLATWQKLAAAAQPAGSSHELHAEVFSSP